jgi:hypothetical protein
MYNDPDESLQREVVGLIPAAGQASRLSPLPCSKELYPVGFGIENREQRVYPKVVCQYLLEKMRLAGISKAYIIQREGKWEDCSAYAAFNVARDQVTVTFVDGGDGDDGTADGWIVDPSGLSSPASTSTSSGGGGGGGGGCFIVTATDG